MFWGKIMWTNFLKVTVIGLASIVASSAIAQDEEVGEVLFMQYCATCHGTDGEGAGPLSTMMTTKVSDLTVLANNNPQQEGVFPMLKVIHIIDGRTGLREHGGTMPTYGYIFMAETATGLERDLSDILATRGRTMSLALYLESIQR